MGPAFPLELADPEIGLLSGRKRRQFLGTPEVGRLAFISLPKPLKRSSETTEKLGRLVTLAIGKESPGGLGH